MASQNTTVGTELVPIQDDKPARREPLVPERTDVFDGDQPVEEKVSTFLARLIPAAEEGNNTPAGALVPWVCDVLLPEYSVPGYGRDLAHFARHMRELGVDPLAVTAEELASTRSGRRP